MFIENVEVPHRTRAVSILGFCIDFADRDNLLKLFRGLSWQLWWHPKWYMESERMC